MFVPLKLMEALQNGSQMRLMMGELTLHELQVAQKTIVDTFPELERVGYGLMPVEPTEGLLSSMCMRYDHGLGLPGYYDFFGENQHAERLAQTQEKMKRIHETVIHHFNKPLSNSVIENLQTQFNTEGVSPTDQRTVKAAIRYTLTQLANQGYVIAPHELAASPTLSKDMSLVLNDKEDGDDNFHNNNPTCRQLYEELVGTGFYSPEREAQYQAVAKQPSRLKM